MIVDINYPLTNMEKFLELISDSLYLTTSDAYL